MGLRPRAFRVDFLAGRRFDVDVGRPRRRHANARLRRMSLVCTEITEGATVTLIEGARTNALR
jgi:hypothetical protein